MKKQEIQEAKNKRIHEMCNMIVRQTNLSFEEANKHLLENNYNYLTVIKNYIGKKEEKDEIKESANSKSVNQKIYTEIRNFMDDTSEKYEIRKKQAEKIELIRQLRENQKKNKENQITKEK